ncbi:MAG TPA: HD-GYP domain-containing protein [Candidatus Krumholzibacteria bacterium]|nr:HD-GYP domain-containing protein [Candidatus Krumholzibacteria bacterium]
MSDNTNRHAGARGAFVDDRLEVGSEHVARLGPELVHGLFSASRTVRIHAMNNRATHAVLQRLMLTIDEFSRLEGRITVAVVTDLLVINDVRLTVDSQYMGPILFLIDEMKARNVETIEILPEVTAEELGTFLQVFFADPATEDAFGVLSTGLDGAGITHIRLTEWIEKERYLRDMRIDKKSIQEESNKVMARAILFLGEVMKSIEEKHPIQVRKAHRLTQQMADIIKIDESVLVGLTSIKDYDEYTFAHSVNVCVLSMLIGERLGMAKEQVAEVGVAGLLHDIGKTRIPLEILNEPGRLKPEDWKTVTRHPMFGLLELTRVRSLRAITSPMFVALQHHVHFSGGGGYPAKPGTWDLHAHTRIVSVADVYDAMTTHRTYRAEPVTPDKALRFIQKMSGTIFDPVVVKAFICAMGVYPVGSTVVLDTGETGVVIRQNRELNLMHRPIVALTGGGDPVDLAVRSEDGAFARTVVRSGVSIPPSLRASHFVST